jgi:uracil-DNA glycosylase
MGLRVNAKDSGPPVPAADAAGETVAVATAPPAGEALRAQFAALAGTWAQLGAAFVASDAGEALLRFLDARSRAGAPIYPPRPLHALELTPADAVRVVILGQDPYHGPGQAHGLAFSVPDGVALPRSLRNIYAELQRDLGVIPRASGNLERWARQGVLLLNTVMTVERDRPASHARHGWETFTDAAIATLARDDSPRVFLLWGAHAQAKRALIDAAGAGHRVLAANHPSPLAARRPPVPFIGCGHFSQANEFLRARGMGGVDW